MCVLSGYCRYSMVNYDYAAIRSTSLQASQTVIAGYVKVVRTGGKKGTYLGSFSFN